MTRFKYLSVALLVVAAMAAAPAANAAATVHFIGAGSSAMYQGFTVSLVNDVAPNAATCGGASGVGVSCTVHHYTVKSTSGCANPCAELEDPRVSPIDFETATASIVYVCSGITDCSTVTDVWAYQQVDSVVGDRSFMSRPLSSACTVGHGLGLDGGCHASAVLSLLDSTTKSSVAGQNLVNPALLSYGSGFNGPGCGGSAHCDDQFLAAGAWTAVSNITGVPITAGLTDVRPEDGLYATHRLNKPLAANGTGLGYCTSANCAAGTPIKSEFSLTFATPINFALPGFNDPITTTAVPTTVITIPVGEAPIVFIVNRKNASGFGIGLGVGTADAGVYENLTDFVPLSSSTTNLLGLMWSGTNCDGSNPTFFAGSTGALNFPINLVQREALSGTMNTTEWGAFRAFGGGTAGSYLNTTRVVTTSQEANINLANPNTNPLDLACNNTDGAPNPGYRLRAVGTGELVNNVKTLAPFGTSTGTTDNLGYTFFSFGNVATLSTSNSYGYLQYDNVDPIFMTYNPSQTSPQDPGQPAGNGSAFGGSSVFVPGTLPACDVTGLSTTVPACKASDIWGTTTVGNQTLTCPAGTVCSFPNLRNGTYRVWSLLRAVCDPYSDGTDITVEHCETTANDAHGDDLGTQGIIKSVQADIDAGNSPPDFLPFQDIQYYRAHYNFIAGQGPGSHSNPSISFNGPEGLNVEENGYNASHMAIPDAGGDAGGCILADTNGTLTTTTVNINTPVAGETTYHYTGLTPTNGGLLFGDKILVSGYVSPKTGDNIAPALKVLGVTQTSATTGTFIVKNPTAVNNLGALTGTGTYFPRLTTQCSQ